MPRGRSHYRVTMGDVLESHTRALRKGGRPGIRDENAILAAIARPYTGFHRTIAKKATALIEAIAMNHGFVDGNKRTSIILTVSMIEQSGFTFDALGNEDLDATIEALVLSIVRHEITSEAVEAWFKARIHRTG